MPHNYQGGVHVPGDHTGTITGVISDTLMDAKGDLITATAADTPARLAVGANDTALIADSAQTVGLKWAGIILQALADAKGDLIAASAADTWIRLAVGANNSGLVADSAQASGLKWISVDRTLHVNLTAVGNVGTGEDDLMSFTVPASTLGTNFDWVEFNAAGTFAASINNKRIRVKYGAATIFDTGALAITAATDWSLEGQIIRVGATSQKTFVRLNTSNATLAAYADYATATETLSGTVVLKLTGEATADNDVVQETFTVRYLPAP